MATKWSEEFKDIKNILNNGYEYTENDYIDVNYFNMLVRNVLGHYSNINDLSNKVQENKDNIRNINTRLDTLGFKEGVAEATNYASVSVNSLKKQGKYVIFNFEGTPYERTGDQIPKIIIPDGFRPKENINVVALIYKQTYPKGEFYASIPLQTNGEFDLSIYESQAYLPAIKEIINAGWEVR